MLQLLQSFDNIVFQLNFNLYRKGENMKLSNTTIIARNEKSLYNGELINVYVTEKSKNLKTGNMAQVNILCADILPTKAKKTGQDKAICGSCILRDNGCYVKDFFAPLAIVKADIKGKIDNASTTKTYTIIRHGAKGDSGYLSKELNTFIRNKTRNILNYTQVWDKDENSYLAEYTMASVHNLEQKKQANNKGFNTYRILQDGEALEEDEVLCKHTETNGRINCKQCLLCGNKGSVNVAQYAI